MNHFRSKNRYITKLYSLVKQFCQERYNLPCGICGLSSTLIPHLKETYTYIVYSQYNSGNNASLNEKHDV